ncbi:MAG: hypothetical protein AAF492_23230 [Verrucomicrobiota bacterium]
MKTNICLLLLIAASACSHRGEPTTTRIQPVATPAPPSEPLPEFHTRTSIKLDPERIMKEEPSRTEKALQLGTDHLLVEDGDAHRMKTSEEFREPGSITVGTRTLNQARSILQQEQRTKSDIDISLTIEEDAGDPLTGIELELPKEVKLKHSTGEDDEIKTTIEFKKSF